MTKKEIIEACAIVAPSIHIQTIWEHDPDALYPCTPRDIDWQGYTPWQSEVRATCIHIGQPMVGSAYLGGTWERVGDNPEQSNPEISGYFPQKVREALEELARQLKQADASRLYLEATKALNAIR